jgi:hypothetical protein
MRLIFLHLVPKSKPGSQAGQARLTWSIPALSAVAGARFRCPDPSNRSVYFSLVDQITKKVRFLVGDMSVPARTNSLKLRWPRIRSITPPLILALLHLEASRNEVSLRPWLGYGCPNLGVRIERRADSHISDWSARVNHVREWKPINLQIWEEDCHQTKHDLRCGPIWIWHLWSNAHTLSPILERPELVTF